MTGCHCDYRSGPPFGKDIGDRIPSKIRRVTCFQTSPSCRYHAYHA